MSNNVSIESLLREIEDILETSSTLPLSGGKVVIDPAQIREVIDEIRNEYPDEIMEARNIAKNRSAILRDAKTEAEEIISNAETRKKKILGEHEIIKKARIDAEEMMAQAAAKANEIRRAANDYIDEQLERVDKYLTANLATFKEARKNVKLSQRAGGKGSD